MSGGQATNSGINYQQRVSAFFMICLYSDFDLSDHLNISGAPILIKKIFFETDTPIDDLVIESRSYNKLFLQIKRRLSLSTIRGSDFIKAINQFVIEFVKSPNEPSNYGIITSSNSSSKITHDLQKILSSINLNDSAFTQNPLNESEKDTLHKFKEAFEILFTDATGKKPNEFQFFQFSQKCFVGILDVEAGQSLELASNMLLRSKGFINPELVWSVLIKISLTYGSQRLSIQKNRLKEFLDKYLVKDSELESNLEEDFLKTNVISKGEYLAGKDILLIDSPDDELDYLIFELFRFGDDCKRRSQYYDDRIKTIAGEEWKIIQRFATMTGLERYMEKNKDKLNKEKVGIFPAKGIENVEDDECVKLHQAHLNFLLEKNKTPLTCLHCGKGITTNNCIIVEIDDRDSQEAVGLVHENCVRPIDRIMGTTFFEEKKISKHLKEFDFKTWIRLLLKGQGMLNALKDSPNLFQGRLPVVAWSSDEEYDREYSYCIRFVLEDGTFVYDYNRSKIVRLNKLEAVERLKFAERVIAEGEKENDPKCFTSIKKSSGTYSQLVKIKDADEQILEIVKVEIVKYSKQIAKLFDKNLEHYSPMCLVRDRESERIINLGNVVPLVSDPIMIENLINNWSKLGFEFEPVELKIIKSDKDFDNTMRMIFSDNFVPIIDPEFDKNMNLIKGYPVQIFEDLINKRGKKSR